MSIRAIRASLASPASHYRSNVSYVTRGCFALAVLLVAQSTWSITATPSSSYGGYLVSWSTPLGCNYDYTYYPFVSYDCYLLEERTGSGSWIPISETYNSTSWVASGKSPGTYSYRIAHQYGDSYGGSWELVEGPTSVSVSDACSEPGSLSGTISSRYGWEYTNTDSRYIAQNNIWNSETAQQTISYCGNSFEVTQQTGASSWLPLSAPTLFMGTNYGRTTANSGLPKQLNVLQSVSTTFDWNAEPGAGTGDDYNAVYDVWFSPTPEDSEQTRTFLMIWLHRQPTQPYIGSVLIAGRTWNVHFGQQSFGKDIIIYAAQEPVYTISFDLKPFIDDAVARRPEFTSNLYLTNIFVGFEIWSGGVGLRTNYFSAEVN